MVEGKVSDALGAAISGVSIRLEPDHPDSAAEVARAADSTSDERGQYAFSVSPGQYRLRAAKSGFRTLVVKDIALAAGGRRRINLILEPGSGEQVIAGADAAGQLPVPPLQFSDTPTFSVAGVTDYSNVGLHGSDANVRTADTLAKDAAAMKPAPGGNGAKALVPGDARRLAGDEKEKNGDPVGALREYQAAVKLDPSEENYFAWGAELLLHRAGPAAAQVFLKGIAAHPQSPRMRAGLAAAYYADGQYSEAALEMCKASDLDPGNSEPYLFLGRMEEAAADPLPCSEEKLARFVSQRPASADANLYYGLVLWKQARKTQNAAGISGAKAHLQKAADLDPELGRAQLQLGLLYNGLGQKDAARDAFEKAVAATPGLSAAHYQLSLAYRRAGENQKADREIQIYDQLRRSEDAELEKERRELRQFVGVLKDSHSSPR